jgi:hypothetical protein
MKGVINMRFGLVIAIAMLTLSASFADEGDIVMNFDLITRSPEGDIGYNIQLQGIHLLPGKPFHGDDLGEFDYFLTVSSVEDGKGKLTIEFYQYESRRKISDVISEVFAVVDFALGSPARFEGQSDGFGVDLAFSIDRK